MGIDLGLVLLILAALGVTHLAVIGAIVGSIVLPNPVRQLQDHGPPEKWGFSPERTIVGDGSPAWYFANADATHAVLVCHGRSRSKKWMLPLVARLAERYAVLAIDFPSHGENRYGTTTVGLRESETVSQALDWLRRRGHDRVFVFGTSMGGAAALLALGARCPAEVQALVTDGTFDELPSVIRNIARRLPLPRYLHRAAFAVARRVIGNDPASVKPILGAAELEIPVLFLHGAEDPLVPPSCAEALASVTTQGRAEYYPGMHDEPDNAAMQEAVLRFFDELAPSGR